MKLTLKLPVLSIFTVLIYFSIFVNFYYVPGYNAVRNVFLLATAIYLYSKKINNGYKILKVNVVASIFVAVIILTSLFNFVYTKEHINNMIVFCFSLIIIFNFLQYVAYKNKILSTIRLWLFLHIIVLFINDFLLICYPNLVYINDFYYLIGNKFDVSYSHCFLITMFYSIRFYEEARLNVSDFIIGSLLACYSFFIMLQVGCSTGIVGLLFFVILFLLLLLNKPVLVDKKGCITLLFISVFFIIGYQAILNISFIQKIITDMLGHTLTISGRTNIYKKLPLILKGHWLGGFGFGTSYTLGMKFGGFPNTQNGVMEWVWQVGLFGTALLLFLIWVSLDDIQNHKSIFVFMILIDLFLIVSTIEIAFNLMFFSVLAIIYGMNLEHKLYY